MTAMPFNKILFPLSSMQFPLLFLSLCLSLASLVHVVLLKNSLSNFCFSFIFSSSFFFLSVICIFNYNVVVPFLLSLSKACLFSFPTFSFFSFFPCALNDIIIIPWFNCVCSLFCIYIRLDYLFLASKSFFVALSLTPCYFPWK